MWSVHPALRPMLPPGGVTAPDLVPDVPRGIAPKRGMLPCCFAAHVPLAARCAGGALAAASPGTWGTSSPLVPLGMGVIHPLVTGEDLHAMGERLLSRHPGWGRGWGRVGVYALGTSSSFRIECTAWPVLVRLPGPQKPGQAGDDLRASRDLIELGLGDGLDALAAVGVEESRVRRRREEREAHERKAREEKEKQERMSTFFQGSGRKVGGGTSSDSGSSAWSGKEGGFPSGSFGAQGSGKKLSLLELARAAKAKALGGLVKDQARDQAKGNGSGAKAKRSDVLSKGDSNGAGDAPMSPQGGGPSAPNKGQPKTEATSNGDRSSGGGASPGNAPENAPVKAGTPPIVRQNTGIDENALQEVAKVDDEAKAAASDSAPVVKPVLPPPEVSPSPGTATSKKQAPPAAQASPRGSKGAGTQANKACRSGVGGPGAASVGKQPGPLLGRGDSHMKLDASHGGTGGPQSPELPSGKDFRQRLLRWIGQGGGRRHGHGTRQDRAAAVSRTRAMMEYPPSLLPAEAGHVLVFALERGGVTSAPEAGRDHPQTEPPPVPSGETQRQPTAVLGRKRSRRGSTLGQARASNGQANGSTNGSAHAAASSTPSASGASAGSPLVEQSETALALLESPQSSLRGWDGRGSKKRQRVAKDASTESEGGEAVAASGAAAAGAGASDWALPCLAAAARAAVEGRPPRAHGGVTSVSDVEHGPVPAGSSADSFPSWLTRCMGSPVVRLDPVPAVGKRPKP